jgi:hypothetical protein
MSDPAGISFGLYGTYSDAYFLLNTQVTLTATADPSSAFIGWKPASLSCLGTDPCIVTMDKARRRRRRRAQKAKGHGRGRLLRGG